MVIMDSDFIAEAERITSFNLATSHFQSLDYKKEIQHLFKKHFFSSKTKTIDVVCQKKLNKTIDYLKTNHLQSFKHMHNYKPTGIGPGEISMYFMVNSAKLGGGSSAGCDLIDAEAAYEIKAASITQDGYAKDYELGRNVPLANTVKKLSELKYELKLGDDSVNISKGQLGIIKTTFTYEFKEIEEDFRHLAFEYFKHHKVIFLNNSQYSPIGRVESIKYVQAHEIGIERIARGTVAPRIKL